MIFAYILFWILLIWGLRDGDLYAKEAAILVVLWAACIAGFTFLPSATIPFIIGSILLDVFLLIKVVGQDVLVS